MEEELKRRQRRSRKKEEAAEEEGNWGRESHWHENDEAAARSKGGRRGATKGHPRPRGGEWTGRGKEGMRQGRSREGVHEGGTRSRRQRKEKMET